MRFVSVDPLILLAMCLWIPLQAEAATYRCEDTSGVVVLTDSPAQLHHCTKIMNDIPSPSSQLAIRPTLSEESGKPSPFSDQNPVLQQQSLPLANRDSKKKNKSGSHQKKMIVPVTRSGGSLMVSAQLNDERTVRLILDTGATMTVLSTDIAIQLGILSDPDSRLTTVNTAGGSVQVTLTHIQTIRVGDATAHHIAVAIHDLPDAQPGVDGLLGMSFLKHFLVTLDSTKGQLHLQPRH